MLQVKGSKIVAENGKEIVLRGFNIGNWMMLENFMFGFPGVEQQFRAAVKKYAGQEKYEYFFDRYLAHFMNEKDVAFLKGMGVNCLRIPFSYKHFESDNEPYKYKKEGFRHLDRLVEICRKYGVYLILDMHSVPGYQNRDWHSDNLWRVSTIYTDGCARDRFYKLWAYLADHYKDEEIIAGYDLINEPVAENEEEIAMLNRIYRECTAAIREVDGRHIIWLSGNEWGRDLNVLDAPFADNLAYTTHYYLDCCTSTPMAYPGRIENVIYDKNLLEQQMDARDAFCRKHNVPCWIGEFGVRLNYEGYTDYRLQAFADQLAVIGERNHHYSIWSYKDSGFIGLMNLKPDCAWLEFAKENIAMKRRYFTDMNFRVNEGWDLSGILGLRDESGLHDQYGVIASDVARSIKATVAGHLADRLGKQFQNLSENELDTLAASWDFDQCVYIEKRLDTIKKWGNLDA